MCLGLASGLTSCVYEDEEVCYSDGIYDNSFLLALHISPVSTRSENSANTQVNEMIKSIRVIMADKDSVEYNVFIESVFEDGVNANSFMYDFLWSTHSGKKKFYIIANENNIKKCTYSSNESNESLVADDLKSLLDNFKTGYKYLEEMDAIMQSLCFKPVYTPDSKGNIYLPYTAIYKDIELEGNKNNGQQGYNEVNMYMVPAAAKFIFNFTNYREYPVSISDISVKYINTSNYIFAKVGELEQTKSYTNELGDTEDLYWIDWLAQISKLSHQFPGYYPNEGFNQKYGWIRDYDMPDENSQEYVFLGVDQSYSITGASDFEDNPENPLNPGYFSIGPFYVAESKNFIDPDGSFIDPTVENDNNIDNDTNTDIGKLQDQIYYLSINITDEASNKEAPIFEDVVISNMQSLFRDTSVIINIIMRQGEVKVYAEIADWNYKSANGWVTEGNNPGSL